VASDRTIAAALCLGSDRWLTAGSRPQLMLVGTRASGRACRPRKFGKRTHRRGGRTADPRVRVTVRIDVVHY